MCTLRSMCSHAFWAIYMGSLTRSFEGLNYIQHRANSLSVSQLAITHIDEYIYINNIII